MIVDLLRSDLSRVCKPFTVIVSALCAVETFATVNHLTSTIEADLKEECDVVDLLRATFPSGSVTGAPKIRAMEVIDQLERSKRGPYCGAIGYFGYDGRVDSSVAIRIIVSEGEQWRFFAGGGITWPSVAAEEYEETMVKAKGIMEALRR